MKKSEVLLRLDSSLWISTGFTDYRLYIDTVKVCTIPGKELAPKMVKQSRRTAKLIRNITDSS